MYHPHHSPSHFNMDLTSPWPYGSYPVPQQYHACCNHTSYPYAFFPPYPPFHPHGFYPPFPGPYPPPYSPLPPQHYSLQQPNHATHHCCGCNHQEGDHKKPEIKAESQVEKKKSDPLIPLLLKDSPDHPIMWLPRGYTEPKAKEKENYSHDPVLVKHHEPSKRDGNSEEGGDGNRFPFQIFWLPSKNDEVGKENNLDLVDMNNNEGSGGEGECETIKKHAVEKAKQASTNKEESSSKHAVQKVIPVKQASTVVNSDSVEKTENGNGSRASPRTSKLPPVCLRIDPLPRKKKSSRSPSPAEKERPNDVNSPNPSQQQAQVLKKSKEERTVDHAKRDDHGDNEPRGKVKEENNVLEHANEVKLDAHEANVPKGKGDENKKEKKNLSEHEAALIIQSVYRGFEVRKSQPLKKLRQIYEVKKQFFELKNRIRDLETSSCTDGKKQVIIGETIMSLLLKLDTIQGLHPFVREVRKSVAKELVGLQEKLDTLSKSETPTEGTMRSPQQDEVNAIQGKNDRTSSCENHATESQCDDDAEASVLEVKSTGIHDKTPTESDIDICKNQEVGEKFNQEVTECDEAMGVCENHAAESQEGCKTVQLEPEKEMFHQAPTESNEALGSCEIHEVGAAELQEGIGEPQLELDKEQLEIPEKEKFHQTPTESNEALGSCENQEVGATESQEGIGEQQLKLDKEQLEEPEKEKFHQTPTESNEALESCENQEVRATETQEGIGEPQMELDKENLNGATTECDEVVELCENHEVEVNEPQEGRGELQLELHKETHEVKAADFVDNEAHDMKLEHDSNNNQDLVPDDTTMNDSDVCQRHEADDNGADNNMVVSSGHGDDENAQTGDVSIKSELPKANEGQVQEGGLVEENEKLRMAVEELMKAGKEQLGVIRELTGRVKDLEKKLSKKKKKIKVNKCRRSHVVQKD